MLKFHVIFFVSIRLICWHFFWISDVQFYHHWWFSQCYKWTSQPSERIFCRDLLVRLTSWTAITKKFPQGYWPPGSKCYDHNALPVRHNRLTDGRVMRQQQIDRIRERWPRHDARKNTTILLVIRVKNFNVSSYVCIDSVQCAFASELLCNKCFRIHWESSIWNKFDRISFTCKKILIEFPWKNIFINEFFWIFYFQWPMSIKFSQNRPILIKSWPKIFEEILSRWFRTIWNSFVIAVFV